MHFNIYSIQDVKTGFMSLALDQNDSSAIRNFRHAMLNKESLMNSHPADFNLYRLGVFDSEAGVIITLPNDHELIASGVSVGGDLNV